MSTNKTILASIAKLNGQNWHTWSKETEAYLTMEDLWDIVNPADAILTAAAALKHDKKAYAHIWFLVDLNSHNSIIELKLGREAWAALKAEHEKDTPSTRMNLCQHFYSLSHNPAIGVMPFVNDVLSVVWQLESIKHKPQTDEITDKLLIGLNSSFSAVCTNLLLCVPEPSIKEITAMLKEFEDNETLCPLSSALPDSFKQELALYVNNRSCHVSRGGVSNGSMEDYDWGNMKKQEGVCWCCGWPGHIAQNYVADMPTEVKQCILCHHAHVAIDSATDQAQLADINTELSTFTLIRPDENIPLHLRYTPADFDNDSDY
jgi:hypothetical protein